MKHLILNPDFNIIRPFANNLHATFMHFGKVIKSGRNELRIFNVQGQTYCVKSFGKPTWANQIIYSFFRKGKAERSYLYAQRLLSMGVSTPQPVGFLNIYNRWRIMTHSYYISVYEPPAFRMSEVLADKVEHKEVILKDFAAFVAHQLHTNGIYHKDFNGNNILVYPQGNLGHHFSLVDLNRIKFRKRIGPRSALINIKGICADPIPLAQLSGYYARERHIDPNQTMFEIMTIKYLNSQLRRRRKTFLHGLKAMFDIRLLITKMKTQ